MRYWLIYDPHVKDYLILDTKIRKSSNRWDSLDNILKVLISDTTIYDEELHCVNKGYYQKLIEFPSLPTYLEFCQAYPELLI